MRKTLNTLLKQAPLFPCSQQALGGRRPSRLGGKAALRFSVLQVGGRINFSQQFSSLPSKETQAFTH